MCGAETDETYSQLHPYLPQVELIFSDEKRRMEHRLSLALASESRCNIMSLDHHGGSGCQWAYPLYSDLMNPSHYCYLNNVVNIGLAPFTLSSVPSFRPVHAATAHGHYEISNSVTLHIETT